MISWTKEWTGKEPDPVLRQLMKADMQSMMSALETECRTDCDRAFLTRMRMHHQHGEDGAGEGEPSRTEGAGRP